MDDKKMIGEFINMAPADLKRIGQLDFVDLNTTDQDYWSTGKGLREGGGRWRVPKVGKPAAQKAEAAGRARTPRASACSRRWRRRRCWRPTP